MIEDSKIPNVPCITHGLDSPAVMLQLGDKISGNYCFYCVMEYANKACDMPDWESFTLYCTSKVLKESGLKDYTTDMKNIPDEDGPALDIVVKSAL